MPNPFQDSDELTEAMEDWEVSRREQLITELRKLREVGWFVVLALVFIAFLLLR